MLVEALIIVSVKWLLLIGLAVIILTGLITGCIKLVSITNSQQLNLKETISRAWAVVKLTGIWTLFIPAIIGLSVMIISVIPEGYNKRLKTQTEKEVISNLIGELNIDAIFNWILPQIYFPRLWDWRGEYSEIHAIIIYITTIACYMFFIFSLVKNRQQIMDTIRGTTEQIRDREKKTDRQTAIYQLAKIGKEKLFKFAKTALFA